MEHAQFGSLDHLLKENAKKNQKMSNEELIQLMQDAISGVKYAHSKGFSNNDIKPQNIFVC